MNRFLVSINFTRNSVSVIRHIVKMHYVENIDWTVFYYHFTYEVQSEFTLYSLPEFKELLARSRRILSESNEIRTHNHLVYKRKLNRLAKW